ncbi:MAG: glycosyltransferase [Deltaproteobacteria bacterium]|nr:glycosyltransferase [Deltaproteobacteria bacterium]
MICHLTSSYPTSRVPYSGHFIHALARQQQLTGSGVLVIAPEADRPAALRETGEPRLVTFEAGTGFDLPGGLKALLETKPAATSARLPGYLQKMLMAVLDQARTAEVIHAHWLAPAGIVALIARAAIGIPVCLTARGSDVTLLEKLPAAAALLFAGVPVAAVSDPLAARLRALGLVRVRTIAQPAATGTGEPPPWTSRDRSRFGWAGSLVPGKRPDLAIEAVRLLPGATLDILGDGPLRAELEKTCTDNGLGGRVRFHGAVPPDSIPAFLKEISALVFTSEAEGRPNIVLEAVLTGTPVIASAIPAVTELRGLGGNFRPFAPGSAGELAAAMRDHMASLMQSRQMAEAARAGIRLPSWPETLESYAELYRSAAAAV